MNYSTTFLRDNIHGEIVVDGWTMQFVNTDVFSRLKRLRQLGMCCEIYTGATHDRSSHSLGVNHLGMKMFNRLCESNPGIIEELGIDSVITKKAVSLATLCHDLGHGPFSHFFESFIRTKNPGWKHERMSSVLIIHMIDTEHIDVDPEIVKMAQQMIEGDKNGGKIHPSFACIVSDYKNGVDVDRMDYICRDSAATDIVISLDTTRIIDRMKLGNDGEIHHKVSNYDLITQMMFERYELYTRVYLHEKVLAMDLMLLKAFLECDQQLKISERVLDPETYVKLTDDIISEIKKCPEAVNANKILSDINHRRFYTCCARISIPHHFHDRFPKGDETTKKIAADIASCNKIIGNIPVEQVHVTRVYKDFGLGSKNPLKEIVFYGDGIPTPIRLLKRSSITVPEHCEELSLMVFCEDSKYEFAVRKAAFEWIRKEGFEEIFEIY